MKRLVIAVVAIGGLLMASKISTAQETGGYPDLRGQWKGTNESIVLGSGPHHRRDDKPGTPRTRKVTFTLDVGGQEGRKFWGKSITSDDTSTTIGIIESDKRTIHFVSAEGQFTGKLTAPDKIDGCYLRAGKDNMVAACLVYTKQ